MPRQMQAGEKPEAWPPVGVARGWRASGRQGVGRADRHLVLMGVLTLLTRLCVA